MDTLSTFIRQALRSLALLLTASVGLTTLGALELDIPADGSPPALLLWVDQGASVSFTISGTWSMWDQWDDTGPEGHTAFHKINDWYLGTLLGRLEGGKDFQIFKGLTFKAETSGILRIYPNRGEYAHLEARGKLHLTIKGVRAVSEGEADLLYGWTEADLGPAVGPSYLSPEEYRCLVWANKARTRPALFARLYLGQLKDRNASAMECWTEMQSLPPRPPLRASRVLWQAARDHALDTGQKGLVGHVSSQGVNLAGRVKPYGTWDKSLSENCSYGPSRAEDIILQLLIDDGVASRGHRRNLLAPDTAWAGMAIRPHSQYRFTCVQDFAGAINPPD